MLKDKVVLITGATDGIGKQTAFLLAQNGATLIIHGKNIKKGINLRDEIIKNTNNSNIFYCNGDFTSFEEINKLSDEIHKQFKHIDILINNAGVYENEKIILKNGLEKNFMVNHLSSFLLTLNLLDLLKKKSNTKIINISSMIHANSLDFENLNGEKYYSGDSAYSITKLCNILFTYELSDRLKNEKITVNAMHPGVINTKLLRAGWGAMGSLPIEAAKRILYLADSEEVEYISGKYFVNNKSTSSTEISYDKIIRKKLWKISMEKTKFKPNSRG
jgi:retinol dehydrogenase 12